MNRYRITLLFLALIVGVMAAFTFSRDTMTSTIHAQETPVSDASMQALLERLRERMARDPAFSISVRFVNPPIPGEPSWQIPATVSEAGATRQLGEIGADYVCFLKQGQTFNDSVCVPYTNILMIVFPNEA